MIKKFYQNVGIKRHRWVLDFHKLSEEPVNVWVIISGRESQGKTINAIQYIRDLYLEKGYTAMLCFNTEDMWPHKSKLLGANYEFYPEKWKDVEYTYKGLIDKKTGKIFLHFANVNTAHKMKSGNRDPHLRTLIYDEFNEGTRYMGENQVPNFDNLLRSAFTMYADPKIVKTYRVFILGNNITAATPLLTHWKIFTLPKNEIELYEYEMLDIMFLNPKINKNNEIEWQTNKNWLVGMGKLNDTYSQSILGNDFLDNLDNVVPPSKHIFFQGKTHNKLLKVSDKYYLKSWKHLDGNLSFFQLMKDIDKKLYKNNIICVNKKEIEVGVIFQRKLKDLLIRNLSQGKIYFDNYTSKLLLRNTLK